MDVRPHTEFVKQHIKGAIHLHLNSMQLRRLCKGICELDTVVADQNCKETLQKRFSADVEMVVYDENSNEQLVTPCIKSYSDVLRRGFQGTLHVLNGGFQAFMKNYGHLCQTPPQRIRSSSIVTKPPTLSLTGTPKPRCLYEDGLLSSPRVPTCPPTEILPHLFIGTAKDSSNYELLKTLGITAILNVSSSCPSYFEDSFDYKRIPVEDAYHEDLLTKFRDAADFIETHYQKGGKVLVHCFAGISRSATVSISYLMLSKGWSMHQAFEFCRERRPCVSPNFNFMGQLLSFQQELSQCPIQQDLVCPLVEEHCMEEDNPSGPMSLTVVNKPCPKKRPGSLSLKFSESRSADNSPCKRVSEGFGQSSLKLNTSAPLSTSDSKLHCSDPLELTTCMQTVTNRA